MNLQNELKIGRADTNHLVIKHPRISGHHCSIKAIDNDCYLIEDMGSTNGTIVNGKRVLQHLLNRDDEILLGDFCLNIEVVFNLFKQKPLPTNAKYEDLEKQIQICRDFEKLH